MRLHLPFLAKLRRLRLHPLSHVAERGRHERASLLPGPHPRQELIQPRDEVPVGSEPVLGRVAVAAPDPAVDAAVYEVPVRAADDPVEHRHVASLEGGLGGWLSRRARTFRKSLRQAERRAEAAGITFEWHDAVTETERAELYARALSVDNRSWKGLEDAGLMASNMAPFYDHMTAYLARRGTLRLVFARCDGEDIAMGFGGILGDTFRGLQMSYDERFRHLSLGNLVQLALITRVAGEGIAHYDLGTEMDYKRRWSEPGMETVALVVRAR